MSLLGHVDSAQLQAFLGTDHGHPGCVNSCEEVAVPEVRFNTRGCFMLPPVPQASGLEVFRFTGCWSHSLCQNVPRMFKIAHSVNSLAAEAAAESSREAFQFVHNQWSDFGVAFAEHGQAVGPSGPAGSLARPQGTPESQPPQRQRQCHGILRFLFYLFQFDWNHCLMLMS